MINSAQKIAIVALLTTAKLDDHWLYNNRKDLCDGMNESSSQKEYAILVEKRNWAICAHHIDIDTLIEIVNNS